MLRCPPSCVTQTMAHNQCKEWSTYMRFHSAAELDGILRDVGLAYIVSTEANPQGECNGSRGKCSASITRSLMDSCGTKNNNSIKTNVWSSHLLSIHNDWTVPKLCHSESHWSSTPPQLNFLPQVLPVPAVNCALSIRRLLGAISPLVEDVLHRASCTL
jgi:hypothetical protein